MSRGEQKLITVAILNRKSRRLQRSLQGVGQPKQRKHGCRKAQYLAVAERLGNDRIVNLPPDLAREFGGLLTCSPPCTPDGFQKIFSHIPVEEQPATAPNCFCSKPNPTRTKSVPR